MATFTLPTCTDTQTPSLLWSRGLEGRQTKWQDANSLMAFPDNLCEKRSFGYSSWERTLRSTIIIFVDVFFSSHCSLSLCKLKPHIHRLSIYKHTHTHPPTCMSYADGQFPSVSWILWNRKIKLSPTDTIGFGLQELHKSFSKKTGREKMSPSLNTNGQARDSRDRHQDKQGSNQGMCLQSQS